MKLTMTPAMSAVTKMAVEMVRSAGGNHAADSTVPAVMLKGPASPFSACPTCCTMVVLVVLVPLYSGTLSVRTRRNSVANSTRPLAMMADGRSCSVSSIHAVGAKATM
jgi:prepilin signal peptidase PulO-like enzyme (type II secretory pathway)